MRRPSCIDDTIVFGVFKRHLADFDHFVETIRKRCLQMILIEQMCTEGSIPPLDEQGC